MHVKLTPELLTIFIFTTLSGCNLFKNTQSMQAYKHTALILKHKPLYMPQNEDKDWLSFQEKHKT